MWHTVDFLGRAPWTNNRLRTFNATMAIQLVWLTNIGDFRFEYEYDIEYEYDFSILFCRFHIFTLYTSHVSWATLFTKTQHIWKGRTLEMSLVWNLKSYSYSASYSQSNLIKMIVHHRSNKSMLVCFLFHAVCIYGPKIIPVQTWLFRESNKHINWCLSLLLLLSF